MSTQFNVVRYSLLGFGVLYGAVHRYNLESDAKSAHAQSQWNKEVKLIKQAKAEFAKLNTSKEPTPAASGSINWEDPNLDFGKALESLVQKLN